ncbi:uncharacterized protein LOC123468774 [Daphnia magna]|uniref:uncharacterized protein LOC123467809 n=2 Tax=Daphnia magna TaxID=35525 RepID=UPI001E1BDC21|nr:uncharacterized protein LOC123467809 [Daphnia magna]XP_045023945.1 uncharacterized protein LOC123468774 [Daphnia magna]
MASQRVTRNNPAIEPVPAVIQAEPEIQDDSEILSEASSPDNSMIDNRIELLRSQLRRQNDELVKQTILMQQMEKKVEGKAEKHALHEIIEGQVSLVTENRAQRETILAIGEEIKQIRADIKWDNDYVPYLATIVRNMLKEYIDRGLINPRPVEEVPDLEGEETERRLETTPRKEERSIEEQQIEPRPEPETVNLGRESASPKPSMAEERWNLVEDRQYVREQLLESIALAKTDPERRERHKIRAKARYETIQELNRKLALISTAEQKVKDRKIEDKMREAMERLKETSVTVARTALPLPTFNGDITAWKGWRLMWASYDQDPQLSEVEKFQYLRNAMRGKAAECIANIQFDKNQYKNVLDKLEGRFGDQKKLKSHYTTELKKLLATRLLNTASTEQLQRIYDGVNNTKLAFENLNIDITSCGEYITTDILDALPKSLTSRWWREKWIEEGDPDVNNILKELGKEIRLREMEEGSTRQSTETSDFRQNRPAGRLAPCCFCQQSHLHHRCTVGTPQTRRAIFERDRRCLKCLGRSHNAAQCTTHIPCRICGSIEHSPALCLGRGRTQNFPNLNRSQSPQRPRTVTIETNTNLNRTVAQGLPTFSAKMLGKDQKPIEILGLIDSGSDRTFIRQDLINRLHTEDSHKTELSINTFGNMQPRTEELTTHNVWMIAPDSERIQIKATAITYMSKATEKVQSTLIDDLKANNEEIADKRHIDSKYNRPEFDLIIECDYFWRIMTHQTKQGSDGSVACASKLGWIIFGAAEQQTGTSVLTTTGKNNTKPLVDFREFWALEHMGITQEELEDPGFLKTYQNTIKRNMDGRYEILFPFRNNRRSVETNKNIASIRLTNLLRKMTKEEKVEYHKIFVQYEKDGYIGEADSSYDGVCTYLPHRPVIKTEAKTTKIRPVFDGSTHQQNKPSINDLLETGPNLNPEILAVLLRFRQNKIAWTADIAQAFLQIGIQEEHEQLIRFLWIEDPDQEPARVKEYRWKRVPFGLSCSPFILRAVILKCLEEHQSAFPELTKQLEHQLYVDDWLGELIISAKQPC